MEYINLITELGFPIACVVGLAWFVYKLYKDSVKREDLLRAEITESQAINKKFAETIAQYTVTLNDMQGDLKQTKHDVQKIKVMLENDEGEF